VTSHGRGHGQALVRHSRDAVRFRCGLPINAIEISSPTSNDDDISKVSVVYKDSDGLGNINMVEVTLKKVMLLCNSQIHNTDACNWSSNNHGT
jgi:hypothetical protein